MLTPEQKASCEVYYSSIKGLMEALDLAERQSEQEDCEGAREEAYTAIQQDPLSIEVRSDWLNTGIHFSGKIKPAEFRILLATGGPAVQITGDLDEYCQPINCKLQYQDWGIPWTDWQGSFDEDKQAVLLAYCQQFYFGE